MVNKTVFVVLVFIYATVAQKPTDRKFRCDYEYSEPVDGWYKLHAIPDTWAEAQLRCHLEGSRLASPLTRFQDIAMTSLLKRYNIKKAFTGISSHFGKGNFASIEGVSLSKIPTHQWESEPDTADGCIQMSQDGAFRIVNCNISRPYICFKIYEPSMGSSTKKLSCGIYSGYGLDSRTGSCYRFHSTPRIWSEAYTACQDEGAHLAIINSGTEAAVLAEMFSLHPPETLPGITWKDWILIGFYDWGHNGNFRTISKTGESLVQAGYSEFAPGQPNNNTCVIEGEYCGSMDRSGKLNDICCDSVHASVCEKEPQVEEISLVNICGTIDSEYQFYNSTGSCYKFHATPRTWTEAYTACQSEGGYLAIINSTNEANAIKEVFAKHPPEELVGVMEAWRKYALIGFYDKTHTRNFRIINYDETLKQAGYAEFAPGEPNNHESCVEEGGEFCGSVDRDGKLNDSCCSFKYASICEMTPNSLQC